MIQSATSLPPVGIVDDLQQCSASADGICPVDTMQTQAGLTERRFICLLEVRLQQQAIEEHVVVTKWHLQRMSSHSIPFYDSCPVSYALVILVIAMSFLQAIQEPFASSVLSNRVAHAKTYVLDVHASSTDTYYAELHDTCTLRIQVQQDKLQCSQYQEIKLAAEMSSLPNNALVLQQRPTQVSQTILYSLSYLGSENLHLAVGATFGQSLQEAGHCGQAGFADSMCNLLGELHHVKMPELLAICNVKTCTAFSCTLSCCCEACFWSAMANSGYTKCKCVHMHCRGGHHC